ncbi:MAG: threonine--tRNA ligase [Acidobacteria bacterium]|nr:MAG: threonine--tRNA ligase [Acidobacteriota bacterium]
MSTIQLTFPDGTVKEFPQGITALEVAKSIGPRLASDALVAKVDGRVVDLSSPIESSSPIQFVTPPSPEGLEVYRHSSAHLLAAAVLELFPDAHPGIGPPTETGFFYDFFREKPFTEDDLKKIEDKMRELVKADLPYERLYFPKDEGLKLFEWMGEFLKCELIREKAEPVFSVYRTGKFVDFCRGPHIPSTARIKAFKLLSVAGAHWKGDERSHPLQRIYGTAFFTQKELDAYLAQLDEARKRDHRRLGQDLDLFSIQDEAGPGLVFWHPKGGLIRKEIEDFLREELLRRGYQLVFTPHVGRLDLWKTSGHDSFYRANMFAPIRLEDAEYQLKPMNCPFHILIYKDRRRSYRELPMRLAEFGTVYRYERSGVMHGLLRVRGFTQDDAHIFCTPEQIESEIAACVDFAKLVLTTFGFDRYEVELSARDPAHAQDYAGTVEDWQRAEGALENTLRRLDIPFKRMEGEAVFYGPKIDVKLIDAIGRPWQLTTVQFDFSLPARFALEYVGPDGHVHQPLMVHRALLGSVERFFGVLIEHYAGAFPVWLSPVQAVVLPISEKHMGYAREVTEELRAAKVRAELDDRNEKLNARIRDAQLQKVPLMLVVGDREAQGRGVAVRRRDSGDAGFRPLGDFIRELRDLIDRRLTKW